MYHLRSNSGSNGPIAKECHRFLVAGPFKLLRTLVPIWDILSRRIRSTRPRWESSDPRMYTFTRFPSRNLFCVKLIHQSGPTTFCQGVSPCVCAAHSYCVCWHWVFLLRPRTSIFRTRNLSSTTG